MALFDLDYGPCYFQLPGTDLWGHSLKRLMAAVVAGGAIVMALMAFMQGQVILWYVVLGVRSRSTFFLTVRIYDFLAPICLHLKCSYHSIKWVEFIVDCHIDMQVLTDPACVDPQKEVKRKKQKTDMSIGTNIATTGIHTMITYYILHICYTYQCCYCLHNPYHVLLHVLPLLR